uniref:SH3 domain-containing protein n=1 Tax=Sediminispirochaeta bajacaliforniensis TaxID=148 RepID=UPI000525FDA9
KYLFILFLTASALSSLSSRDWDIQYECIRETYAYHHEVGDTTMFSLPKGSIIESDGMVSGYPFRIRFKDDKRVSWVLVADVMPVDSDPLPEKLIGPVRREKTQNGRDEWISSYLLPALYAENPREYLYNYEPFWRDDYNAQGRFDWWNEWYYAQGFRFYNITLIVTFPPDGTNSFIITKIEKKDQNTYWITAIVNYVTGSVLTNWQDAFANKKNETVKLILEFDGDYLDIYLNDDTTKLSELVLADKDIQDALIQKMKLEPVDLSTLHWPTRADGSMDYPKIQADLSNFSPTHTTIANLRLRIQPDTSAGFFTTLPEGTKVQVTEERETETIDGITASWVEVISESGYKGWCFGGYLAEMVTEQPEDVREYPITSEDGASSNSTVNQLQTSWLLSVVGAGVLLVIAAVIVVILRKRK